LIAAAAAAAAAGPAATPDSTALPDTMPQPNSTGAYGSMPGSSSNPQGGVAFGELFVAEYCTPVNFNCLQSGPASALAFVGAGRVKQAATGHLIEHQLSLWGSATAYTMLEHQGDAHAPCACYFCKQCWLLASASHVSACCCYFVLLPLHMVSGGPRQYGGTHHLRLPSCKWFQTAVAVTNSSK
jgi:hypothetical protein